jgi:PST family polysaccharide transporter
MAAAIATAAIFVMLSGLIADLLRMPALEPVLQALALLLPLNASSAISQKLLERELAYGRLAAIDTATYLIGYVLVAVPAALAGYGVWSLVLAQLGAAFLRSACLLWAQPHSMAMAPDWATYKELMRTGVGFSLARLFNVLAQKGDYFVVGRWLGVAQLGFYERAYVLMDLSNNLLTNSMSTVLFPAFARLQDDRSALGRAYLRCCAMLGLLFCPCSIAAAILAPEIVAFLLGPRWDAVVAPFQVLAFGMFFRTGSKISNVLANSVGAVYRNARSQAIYAFLIVAGAWLVLPYGILGVAFTTLFARASIYLMLTHVALDITRLRWIDLLREYRPALLCSIITGAVVAVVATLVRPLDLWPVATLALALGSALLALSLAAFAWPAVLGSHGGWLLSEIRARLRPLSRRLG